MKNHLKSKHPDEFSALNDKNAVEPTTVSLAIAGTSSSSVAKKQSTMTESYERKLLWDINDTKARKYHYLVAEMIALDNEPLSIVERNGFTRLLEQALPRYKLPTQQWNLMEQCINLLKPFEEITKITSSGLSCVSEVIPHVTALKKYLDKTETEQRTPDLSHMRASLKAELETRFTSIRDLIGIFRMSCEESSSSSSCSTPAKTSRGEETEPAVSCKAHDSFWDCFDEVANENNTDQVQREERNAITCELDFISSQCELIALATLILGWAANAKQYPNLIKFVKIYLSAPCSSVYSERVFSEAGLIYEEKRNRLLPLNAEKLVFIHHNLPLVQYEY
ncbi:hypothetical protein ABMA27_003348 [Loxostege sticticalis]|uniref:HAT C-terminal dimerisation domain-containing protein n=1 Tax=Loxostege sticticalis TaxID=481309 RepID=A0ABR3HT13_LOXSC